MLPASGRIAARIQQRWERWGVGWRTFRSSRFRRLYACATESCMPSSKRTSVAVAYEPPAVCRAIVSGLPGELARFAGDVLPPRGCRGVPPVTGLYVHACLRPGLHGSLVTSGFIPRHSYLRETVSIRRPVGERQQLRQGGYSKDEPMTYERGSRRAGWDVRHSS